MKNILLILSLCLMAVCVSAQEKKKDYSEYQPCAECFEDWKVSESKTASTESPGISSAKSNRERKPFRDTYVGQTINSSARVIVGTTLMIFTAVILTKATKPSVQ